jgi:hypothetical protein
MVEPMTDEELRRLKAQLDIATPVAFVRPGRMLVSLLARLEQVEAERDEARSDPKVARPALEAARSAGLREAADFLMDFAHHASLPDDPVEALKEASELLGRRCDR